MSGFDASYIAGEMNQTRVSTKPVSTQEFYSSELFNHTYKSETNPAQPPGDKWSAKRFSSGVHASASNERFNAMRDANVDKRPFAGMPYAPSNTFVTTGKLGGTTGTFSATITDPTETAPKPVVPEMAPRKITLAQLLASR